MFKSWMAERWELASLCQRAFFGLPMTGGGHVWKCL
jgi:hypothetical protein